MNKFTSMLICLFFIIISSTTKADTIDTIIKGASEFLVERAKQNNFYIFEKSIQNDCDFKTYFPITYSYIADGDLKVLLTQKSIWEKAVKKDLEIFITRTFAKSINRNIDLNNEAIKGVNNYVSIAKYLSIDIDGQLYPLNSLPINKSKNINDIINGFWNEPIALQESLRDLGNLLKSYEDVNNIIKDTPLDELKKQTEKLIDAFANLNKLTQHINAHKSQLRINLDEVKKECSTDPKLFFCKKINAPASDQLSLALNVNNIPVKSIIEKAKKLDNFLHKLSNNSSNTERVILAMQFLKEIDLEDLVNVDKLKKHVLFFAQLADVKDQDSNQVKSILTDYTMPAVSFFVKREKGINNLMLTSYFGYAYGKTFRTPDDNNSNKHGIIAPIGLEISHGFKWSDSISLLLAPVDLGYPITLKINGIEEKFSWNDIFAPGVYLAYGIRELPINFGIAYQRGRRIAGSNDVENRVLFFISYDMPLISFY